MAELKLIVDQTGKSHNFDDPNHFSLLGGDTSNPTWKMYIEEIEDEWKPHFNLIKDWLKAQEKIPCSMTPCGDNMFTNVTTFEFSDGKSISFSMRGWGDFAQAVVDQREGYMAYYGSNSSEPCEWPSLSQGIKICKNQQIEKLEIMIDVLEKMENEQ